MIQPQQRIRSVVFAEDDEDDQLYFKEVFREIDPGIHIVFVTDGIRLSQLLQHFLPDLLFLDLEMPYKNGLQCLVELRENPVSTDLPVVVFSSTVQPANIQTAYEMGADLFLHKSSRYSEYADSLKKIINLDWDHPGKIRKQYFSGRTCRSFN